MLFRSKLIDFIIRNFEIMHRNDQDALNAVLYNDWFPLSPDWNAHLYFYTSPHLCFFNGRKTEYYTADPAIIHYTTQNKPWFYNTVHPFKNEYSKYLKLSPWAGYSAPDLTLKNLVSKNWGNMERAVKKNFKRIKRGVKKLVWKG